MPDLPEETLPQQEEAAAAEKKKTPRSTGRLLLGFLLKLLLIAAAVWALLTFVLGLKIHYGNNMFPSVRDGDLIISLRLQKPFLNAAVLYEREDALCLGRVVGMPGDVIDITEEGALTVNGARPAEEVFYPTYRPESGGISFPCTVEDGRVFILNDFRSDVNDSRSFGTVAMEDIQGPILLLLRRRGF